MFIKDGLNEMKISDLTVENFQKALSELYLSKNYSERKITLYDDVVSIYALEIYLNAVVLRNFVKQFDGPGGPGEIFSARINVKHIFDNAEKILDLLNGCEQEGKLIELLKSLPKTE